MIQYTAQDIQFQEGNVASLWYFLHQIPDHRDPRGFRHPLPLVLTIAILAICCGRRGYEDIASWATDYQQDILREIPFLAGHMPDPSTYYRVFADLDTDAFEAVVASWVAVYAPSASGDGIAIDGKTLRGSRTQGAPGSHLLSALSHRLGLTLFQQAVDDKTNEMSTVQEVLQNLVLEGRVVTMDALLTQRKIAASILEGGGDYVMIAKDNQSQLLQDIQLVFQKPIQ